MFEQCYDIRNQERYIGMMYSPLQLIPFPSYPCGQLPHLKEPDGVGSQGTSEKHGYSAQVLLSPMSADSNSPSFSFTLFKVDFAFVFFLSRVCEVFRSIVGVHVLLGEDVSAPIGSSLDFLVREGVAKDAVTSESLSLSFSTDVCPAW